MDTLMGYLEIAYFYDITGQFSTNFHHAIDYLTASGTLPRKKSTILANFIIFDSKLDPRGPNENCTKNGFTLGSKRRIFIVKTMKKQFLYHFDSP